MVNQIKTLCLTCVKTHGLIILITAVSSGTSCVLSFTMALTSFAAMQMFKQQLAGSEYMTIVGGLLGSTIFFFVLVVSFCLVLSLLFDHTIQCYHNCRYMVITDTYISNEDQTVKIASLLALSLHLLNKQMCLLKSPENIQESWKFIACASNIFMLISWSYLSCFFPHCQYTHICSAFYLVNAAFFCILSVLLNQISGCGQSRELNVRQ